MAKDSSNAGDSKKCCLGGIGERKVYGFCRGVIHHAQNPHYALTNCNLIHQVFVAIIGRNELRPYVEITS
jgi:hypothetical protein